MLLNSARQVDLLLNRGMGYFMFRKTVNEKAMHEIRQRRMAAEKARRQQEAQLRLLQLDVKSAEIRLAAALDNVERLSASDSTGLPARRAKSEAQLAEIAVERAKIAVELYEVEHE